MKASISISSGTLSLIALISSNDSSLAVTTLWAPCSYQNLAATELLVLACVLMCTSILGIVFLTIENTPASLTITASTPISWSCKRYGGSCSSSSLLGIIFIVTKTCFPKLCANSTPSFISSIVKFFAADLIPNISPPIYTASAP